jgi:hypothetical protein
MREFIFSTLEVKHPITILYNRLKLGSYAAQIQDKPSTNRSYPVYKRHNSLVRSTYPVCKTLKRQNTNS